MENKPEDVELVLTGRYAPKSVIDKADLVTEMKEIKHYYSKGVMSISALRGKYGRPRTRCAAISTHRSTSPLCWGLFS